MESLGIKVSDAGGCFPILENNDAGYGEMFLSSSLDGIIYIFDG